MSNQSPNQSTNRVLAEESEPVVCYDCGFEISNGDEITSENEYIYCATCYYDTFFACPCCDGETLVGDGCEAPDQPFHVLCESCYDDRYVSCNNCDRIVYRDDIDNHHLISNTGDIVCGRCYEESQNEYEDEDENDLLHDYSYTPHLYFRSTDNVTGSFRPVPGTVYLGIEVECETSGAMALENVVSNLPSTWWAKHDGSLGEYGMELCAQPSTLDVLSDEVSRVCALLQSNRVQAWNTDTCGLHIHISRTAFISPSKYKDVGPIETPILIASYLLYRNATEFIKLAGRNSRQWASFDSERGKTIQTYLVKGKNSPRVLLGNRRLGNEYVPSPDRYSALNVQPKNTVELRFFRPSTKTETVLSCLECADAIANYCRCISAHDCLNKNALSWQAFRGYVSDTKATYPHLNAQIDHRVGNQQSFAV